MTVSLLRHKFIYEGIYYFYETQPSNIYAFIMYVGTINNKSER